VFKTVRLYWPLIKAPQTGLLLATGIAGYLSAGMPISMLTLLGLALSLLLAISGSTMLNMRYDRDIDAKMNRTRRRPLASGALSAARVLRVGVLLSVLGVGGALAMAPLYGLVVLSGWFFDVVVYTLWLKRRTCWSIAWGGISGAMPILSGRVLAVGRMDLSAGTVRSLRG
jgi:protoheme IX farnesyltransferase